MSHFLEHMMFKGTTRLTASDISEAFDRLGAELNAFTGKEYTCYFSRFVDEHLDEALALLSEMVGDPALLDDAIASEKEVVLEEIARHEDAPDDLVHDALALALWPGHPLARPILGSADTVGVFDRSAARGYLDRHYRTGDLVVVAAGHVEHGTLVDLVREHVRLPVGEAADRAEMPPSTPVPLKVVTKDTEQAHICWGVQALRADDEERFVLAVMNDLLGGGMSSRLFQEIREKRGLAYAVFSYPGLYRETGSLAVYAGTRPANVGQVVGLIREQTAKLTTGRIKEEELLRSKESIKGQLVLSLENTRNRMTRMGKNEITRSDILGIDEIVERIEAVSTDDVRSLAGRLLGGESALALVGPFDEDQVSHLVA
jgi:predicted Zn-dependent peptidase